MLKHLLPALMFVLLVAHPLAAPVPQAATRVPTVDDLLNVSSLGSPQISPDGDMGRLHRDRHRLEAGRVRHADLGGARRVGPALPADARRQVLREPAVVARRPWLAFTSSRVGDKNQVFAIRPDGGEAIQLTNAENGVGDFAWSRDGKQIAFTSSDAKERDTKARKDHLGDFEVVRKEYAHQHLWTIDVAEAMASPAAGTERTKGKDFTVGVLLLVARRHAHRLQRHRQPRPDPGRHLRHLRADLADERRQEDRRPARARQRPALVARRPQLVFSSAMGNPRFFHANSRLAVVSADGGDAAVDHRRVRRAAGPGRLERGRHLLRRVAEDRLAPVPRRSGQRRHHAREPAGRLADARRRHASRSDGKSLAFAASSPTSLGEIFVSAIEPFAPRRSRR